VNEVDSANLWDMLEAARQISEYVKGHHFSDLETNRLLRDGIERQLEIVGEAARRISAEFREQHPEIPWTPIIAQRNVIAHEYGDIKEEWIWLVATERIPELIGLLGPLVPPPTKGPDG
jgi:uncharacterized protein with HEPN domain